jgi:hypothetical protein
MRALPALPARVYGDRKDLRDVLELVDENRPGTGDNEAGSLAAAARASGR